MNCQWGITPELSRTDLRPRRSGTRHRASRAAKRSRLERIVMRLEDHPHERVYKDAGTKYGIAMPGVVRVSPKLVASY